LKNSKRHTYYLGDNKPSPITLYNKYIKKLGKHARYMMENDKEYANNGFIVNTCGWVTGLGEKIIKNAIKTLKIDHVIVINDKNLENELKKKFENINFENFEKNEGVAIRE
jgi:polyribonucleotide 5'-hydroxyl-kinase